MAYVSVSSYLFDFQIEYPIVTHFDNLKKVCDDPDEIEELEKVRKEFCDVLEEDALSAMELTLDSERSGNNRRIVFQRFF